MLRCRIRLKYIPVIRNGYFHNIEFWLRKKYLSFVSDSLTNVETEWPKKSQVTKWIQVASSIGVKSKINFYACIQQYFTLAFNIFSLWKKHCQNFGSLLHCWISNTVVPEFIVASTICRHKIRVGNWEIKSSSIFFNLLRGYEKGIFF